MRKERLTLGYASLMMIWYSSCQCLIFSGIVRGFLQYSANIADHNILLVTGLAEVIAFSIVEVVVVATAGASVA